MNGFFANNKWLIWENSTGSLTKHVYYEVTLKQAIIISA